MLNLLLIPTAFLALAFIGLAIRLFLIKVGRYRKFCDNADLETGEKIVCTCGGQRETVCQNR